MKKIYFLALFVSFLCPAFSQNREILSRQRAEKIAAQRNYDEWETKAFVEKATTIGVCLKSMAPQSFRIPASVASAATNLDFELQNFTGWSGNFTTYNCTSPTPNVRNSPGINFSAIDNGNDQHGIVTMGNDLHVTNGTLPMVCPFSGSASCRVGDAQSGCGAADLSQTFTVALPDTQITVYYAVWLDNGHPPADGPVFRYSLYDGSGNMIDSVWFDNSSLTSLPFVPSSTLSTSNPYCPWQARTVSLANYIGQNVTLQFVSSDCNGGAHSGYAYVDVNYGGSTNSACGFLNPKSTCFASVASNNTDNLVYYQHSPGSAPQMGTVVYRQNGMGNWDSLGTVPAGQPDMFTDTSAHANTTSRTYCVAPIDSCKSNYSKSTSHTTMYLQSNISGNGQINLSWNPYGGLSTNSYHIFRGASPATMAYLDQVPGTTTYTDVNPPVGNNYYKVVRVTPAGCTSNAPLDSVVSSNYVYHNITCNNAVNPPASICFVTTNDSLHNEVFFEHSNSGGTIIYRQNSLSQWDSIGYVPSSQTDHFIDYVANPNQQSYVYCVESVDSCGNLHGKSAPHTTILLQSSLGTNSQVNLSWNAYIGTTVASYYIYRGTTSANLTFLNQVSSSTLAYTDLTPPLGTVYYRINFVGPSSCTSNEPHGPLVGSNYRNNNIVGIGTVNLPLAFSMYPNPANSVLTLESSVQHAEYLLVDVLGNTVRSFNCKAGKTQLDIAALPEGVYFITLKDAQHKTSQPQKLVVQH